MEKTDPYGKCRNCYICLPEANRKIGVCDSCAERELARLKTRMKTSWIIGILMLVFQVCLRIYVRSHYVDIDILTVSVQTLLGPVKLGSALFYEIFFPSKAGELIFLAFWFFLPFSQLTYLSLSPVKDWAIRRVQSLDAVLAHKINRTSGYNYDDIGMFVIAVLLAFVAGPFWFAYRTLRIHRLEKYLARR